MNQELYQYAISYNKYNRIYNKQFKKSIRILWIIVKYSILLLLSIPIMMFNIWHFVILVAAYFLLMLYNSRETDEYAKFLFDTGSALLFLDIVIIYLNSLERYNLIFFALCFIIGLVIYEIFVLIKIKLKKYYTHREKPKKEKWGIVGSLGGVAVGRFLARRAYKSSNPLFLFLRDICYLMLFILTISLLQRYVVYKILKKKYPEVFAKTN